MMRALLACAAALAALAGIPAEARTEKVQVHGPSLEGNLEGNAAMREVRIFLPPGYDGDTNKRYPTVYFLHGYFANAEAYDGMVNFQEAVDAAAAAGNELIVIVPDAHTKQKGAMYSASPTTGDFEAFVARDLVAYVDANYRTLARRASRGLSGHSMGGYGTLKIAMKYPQVFSSIYAMAPCCLAPRELTVDELQRAAAMSPEQQAEAGFAEAATLATLAAWAPDPQAGPNYFARGLTEDGEVDPLTQARVHANSPLVMLPQYLPAMRGLEAIAIDVGDKDFLLRDDTWMHEELERFGIAHEFEIFDGDHGNRVAPRFRSELLPFFARHLDK
jgi:enterochelin esterase-like enzyme